MDTPPAAQPPLSNILPAETAEEIGVIVLGSSSARRQELLSLLFPARQIHVEPPRDSQEEELHGLLSWPQIEQGLLQIVQHKTAQVLQQLQTSRWDYLLTADTGVVVSAATDQFHVLSKPNSAAFPEQVRGWFQQYYRNQTHHVLTALQWTRRGGQTYSQIVRTQIRMSNFTDEQLEWYLATGESLGKAGGYAIQGLGSCLISGVEGSLSNVIGLPLAETWELFQQVRTRTTAS